jgi:site-specific DNA recombinase
MYVDKLDGLVDAAFFEKMSNQWREEQERCQSEIERHRSADKSYLSEEVALLELARDAQRLFAKQEPREKRRLLHFLLSNCTWDDGKVVTNFRQPFDMLAETVIATRGQQAAGALLRLFLRNGSPGRIRTSDQPVNSRLLYH